MDGLFVFMNALQIQLSLTGEPFVVTMSADFAEAGATYRVCGL